MEVVRKPAKPTPEKVAKRWAEEWAKEGEKVDWAKAHAAERLSGVTPQMGSGEDLLLALSEQDDEQGLREVVRHRRSVHLCGDGKADGKAAGSCLEFSDSFRRVLLGNQP